MKPLFLIKNYLGKNFLFLSNLNIKEEVVTKFPKDYHEILTTREKVLILPKGFYQLLSLNLFGLIDT